MWRGNGSRGIMSEIYGVTTWTFEFLGHIFARDWQAALGVTTRVHHLSWVTMAGEAKRDFPASIGYQSPWSLEYPLVEDHFARANVAMTRGRAVCRVAIIHPIESYWLCCFSVISILGYVRSAIYTGLFDLASVANSPVFISFAPL